MTIPTPTSSLIPPILSPIPHIPLAPPHSEYCLTTHLPTDVNHLPRICDQPKFQATFGYAHEHMTLELAKEWLDMVGEKTQGFPFNVIRKIEWLNSDSPAYIGYFGIKPESFRQFMERAGPLKEKYDGLPVEEKQYQISYMIDEGYEGRGLLTAAGRAAIQAHPHIRHHPGQLTAGYLHINPASKRVQEKLGFVSVARSPGVYKGHDVIDTIWVEESACSKWESIFVGEADL